MHYTLSTNNIHLSPATSRVLERRIQALDRHIPGRLKSQSLAITLHENLSKNYVEGVATLQLPGKTLVAKSLNRNIKQTITQLTETIRRQVVEYKTLHDRSHSQYPDKSSIRYIGAMQSDD